MIKNMNDDNNVEDKDHDCDQHQNKVDKVTAPPNNYPKNKKIDANE